MELISYSIHVIHGVVSVLLIIVVLLQPGKGGDLGSVFGGGGGGGTSESIFGASGAVPFLSKVTRVLAVLFLLSSLTLGYFAAKNVGSSVVTDIPATQQTTEFSEPDEAFQPQAGEGQTAPAEVSGDTEQPAPDSSGSMSAEPGSSEGSDTPPAKDSETPPAKDEGTQ